MAISFESTNKKRILVVSQREIVGKDHVANSVPFEFEDWIASLDVADVITPRRISDGLSARRKKGKAPTHAAVSKRAKGSSKPSLKQRIKAKLQLGSVKRSVVRSLRRLIWSTPLNRFAAPKVEPIHLEHEYDLLYVILTEPWEIFNLKAIPNWREKCRYAVCHFVEIWQKEVEDLELLRKEYAAFDKIFSNTFAVTEEVTAVTGRPCEFLPFTVDAVKFCPYPNPPERFIDVSYIGRRSPVTHEALLDMASEGDFFYLYDTMKEFRMRNHKEHRSLLANQLKRTRYFFANPSKLDDNASKGRPLEFGWRYFEGLAAGTVVLGTVPETETFRQYFNWPGAVISLPFDVENIDEVIAELESQPDRIAKIRRDNIVNALQRYDWFYIWKHVLDDAGLPLTEQLQDRQALLEQMAEMVDTDLTKVVWPATVFSSELPAA
ncbi:MAG TPA: glycosyltransferase [Trichocoleus sp.]